jgi:hypothetical protein
LKRFTLPRSTSSHPNPSNLPPTGPQFLVQTCRRTHRLTSSYRRAWSFYVMFTLIAASNLLNFAITLSSCPMWALCRVIEGIHLPVAPSRMAATSMHGCSTAQHSTAILLGRRQRTTEVLRTGTFRILAGRRRNEGAEIA